jgi:hypothetical protein
MKITHIINAANPKLSDEESDPMEKDDQIETVFSITIIDGWSPWDPEDVHDIRKVINRLDPKQQFILDAFLDGLTYNDISVTEKYWRYHFAKGLEIIKKELNI